MHINISIVIPVYSGVNYLDDLTKKILDTKEKWENDNCPFSLLELIYVDDASGDGSGEVLSRLSKFDWINVVTLSMNYGQHAATAAGIAYSSGDWVVTMDEDLQHDPGVISDMLKLCVNNGSDIVYANSPKWIHSSVFRDLSSRVYKRLISVLVKNPNISSFNSFRLVRGSIARSASAVCSHDGYFDVVLSWFTNRVSAFEVEMKDMRYAQEGKSGYNLRSLLTHARKLIMTSDAKLLRWVALLGILMLVLCIVLSIGYILLKLYYPELIVVQGWTSVILVILGIGGGLTLMMSAVAEYIAVITQHVHGKPTFSVVDRSSDKVLFKYFNK